MGCSSRRHVGLEFCGCGGCAACWYGRNVRSFNLADDVDGYSAYRLVVTQDNDDRAPVVIVSIGELAVFAGCGFAQ